MNALSMSIIFGIFAVMSYAQDTLIIESSDFHRVLSFNSSTFFQNKTVITYHDFIEFYHNYCGEKTKLFDLIDINGNDIIENAELLFMFELILRLNGDQQDHSLSDNYVWFLNESQNANLADIIDDKLDKFSIHIQTNFRHEITIATLTNITMYQIGEFIDEFPMDYIDSILWVDFYQFFDVMIVTQEWDIISGPDLSTHVSIQQFQESFSKLKCVNYQEMIKNVINDELIEMMMDLIIKAKNIDNNQLFTRNLMNLIDFPDYDPRIFRRRLPEVDQSGSDKSVTAAEFTVGGLTAPLGFFAAIAPLLVP